MVLFSQGKIREASEALRRVFSVNNLGYFIKIRYALFLIVRGVGAHV